jgi:hypothetical protein
MFKQLKKNVKFVGKAMWCHRAAYAGLALAYGLACLGWLEKDVVNQIVAAIYAAMVAQRH